MKIGMRVSDGIQCLLREIMVLEIITTKRVANASPKALITEFETANRGQSPSKATVAWFFFPYSIKKILFPHVVMLFYGYFMDLCCRFFMVIKVAIIAQDNNRNSRINGRRLG